MFSWLFSKKHDKRFIEIFKLHIGNTVKCSHDLCALLGCGEDTPSLSRTSCTKRIRDWEYENDLLVKEAHDLLGSVFITQIEKDDIVHLVTALDDITDSMKAAVRQIEAYNIVDIPTEAQELSGAIVLVVKGVHDLIVNMNSRGMSYSSATDFVVKIKEHEKSADDKRWNATKKLFSEENDWKKGVAWKEIFRELEQVSDHCVRVAIIASFIIRKMV